jgi:hypothetical protein
LFVPSGAGGGFSVGNPAFLTYDLASSIGPISAGVGSGFTDFTVPTSLGKFTWFGEGGTNPTFTAQLMSAAVPEPATAVLLSTGALGLLGYAWRRRRREVVASARLI